MFTDNYDGLEAAVGVYERASQTEAFLLLRSAVPVVVTVSGALGECFARLLGFPGFQLPRLHAWPLGPVSPFH